MDITALRAEQQRLEERATQDDLTALRNRAGALEEVVRMLRAGSADGGSALLFLDLDDFKSVNDDHGHAAGDRLLVQVADALRRAVRDGDVAARLGGDEFVVCLPGVHEAHRAEQLAARVREEVRGALHLDGRPLGLDVSVGIALSEDDDDAGSLLRRADAAMYAAKFARRRGSAPGGAEHGTALPL
jgi:diguanylate cyclase (GGDEF)-like protein